MNRSKELFDDANKVIPGGVNSPVRAFTNVGGIPMYIKRANGSKIYDIDGNDYIDFVGSWGPMILGHNNPKIREKVIKACDNGLSFGTVVEDEIKMAKLICECIPSIEMVRMVNSGTEAVMSAIRLARAYTNRTKIIKFAGCYHGHVDSMLVKAGSGLMDKIVVSDSSGIPNAYVEETLVAQYNDIDSVETLFEKYSNEIAAVIIEPVAANMGVVLPEEMFLKRIRKICSENKSLLIFDEVITGFRLSLGGAQELFGIMPDLTTLGKIIGAGLPAGAFGGKKEIMQLLAPNGSVYQAGTLSGNPVVLAAGIEQIEQLILKKDFYTQLNNKSDSFFKSVKEIITNRSINCSLNSIGSLGCIFFGESNVRNYAEAQKSNLCMYKEFHNYMLKNGVYFAPSQFESIFISNAHSKYDLDVVLDLLDSFFIKNRR